MTAGLLGAFFKWPDDQLGGALAGLPSVSPRREVWSNQVTWYEVLGLDAEEFDEAFSALGSSTGKLRYLPHQRGDQMHHPTGPYGNDDLGSRIKLYTYKRRLPRDASVRDYQNPSRGEDAAFPQVLKNHLDRCESNSFAKKRERTGTTETNALEANALEANALQEGTSKRSRTEGELEAQNIITSPTSAAAAAVNVSPDADMLDAATLAGAAPFSPAPAAVTRVAPPEMPFEQQRMRRKLFDKSLLINPSKTEADLSDHELSGLYALLKRGLKDEGDETMALEIPAAITLGPNPLKVAVVPQRQKTGLGKREASNYARVTAAAVLNTGAGDFGDGMALVGARNKGAFEEAAGILKMKIFL